MPYPAMDKASRATHDLVFSAVLFLPFSAEIKGVGPRARGRKFRELTEDEKGICHRPTPAAAGEFELPTGLV